MRELLRTNNPVLVSFVEALLKEAGISYHVADTNMSVAEGSIGIFPRRVLVETDRWDQARRMMVDADLGHELPREHQIGGAARPPPTQEGDT